MLYIKVIFGLHFLYVPPKSYHPIISISPLICSKMHLEGLYSKNFLWGKPPKPPRRGGPPPRAPPVHAFGVCTTRLRRVEGRLRRPKADIWTPSSVFLAKSLVLAYTDNMKLLSFYYCESDNGKIEQEGTLLNLFWWFHYFHSMANGQLCVTFTWRRCLIYGT